MPVRSSWSAVLDGCVADASRLADRLSGLGNVAPVDLVSIADALDVEVVVRPNSSGLHGRTSVDNGRYVIRVDGGTKGALIGGRQRFSIAHELAHVIFLKLGVPPPAGRAEYWRLEDCCNRVAGRLLVPRWMLPGRALVAEEIAGWLNGLTKRAGVTPAAASKELALSSENARGTLGLRTREDGRCVVTWQLAIDDFALPGTGRVLADEDPLAALHWAVLQSARADYRSADVSGWADIDAVAVPAGSSTAVFFLERATDHDQLALFTLARSSIGVSNP